MFPTTFQKKTCWVALTALAFVVIGAVAVMFGVVIVKAIAFMKPVLMPLAIAGIFAYLLEPVVAWLAARKVHRTLAVTLVFVVAFLAITLMTLSVVPAVFRQGAQFIQDFPKYSRNGQELVVKTYLQFHDLLDRPRLPGFVSVPEATPDAGDSFANYISGLIKDGTTWLQQKIPSIALSVYEFMERSIGSVFGVFGVMLSLVLVPIFLFFFLLEGPAIASSWSKYLPLRASPFKREVVEVLTEINGYLINFFRGQLLVSMIDGLMITIALLFMGLDFALLIGIAVAFIGLVPYAGVIICWIPAVIIATAQFGDWLHPVLVTVIFLAVNNIDGIFIAPKIVGESVGLHPLTVIISVLAWSIILGGLLGALLAVPLTATLKVLLRRYFWEKPGDPPSPQVTKTELVLPHTS